VKAMMIKTRSTATITAIEIICEVAVSILSACGAVKLTFTYLCGDYYKINTLNRRQRCWFRNIFKFFVAIVPLAATEIQIFFSRFAFGHTLGFVVTIVVVDETSLKYLNISK